MKSVTTEAIYSEVGTWRYYIFSKKNCLLVRGKLNFNEKILQFAAWHAVLDIAIKDAA